MTDKIRIKDKRKPRRTGATTTEQLMELVGHENENVEDIEIEGIDCANWDRNEAGLLKVPENHINDILCQCHDSKLAGHWG